MDAADEANLSTEDSTSKTKSAVFGSTSPRSQRPPMRSPPPSPPEADPSASSSGSAAEPPPQPNGAGAKRSFSFKKRVLSKRAAPSQQQQPPAEAAEEEQLLPQPVRLPPPVPPPTLRHAQPPAAAVPRVPPPVPPRRQLPPPPAPAPARAQSFSNAGAPSAAPDRERAWEIDSSEEPPQDTVQSAVWRLLATLSYWIRRDLGTASIRFVVRGATGLINTDVAGKSDPYAKVMIGSYHWKTCGEASTRPHQCAQPPPHA